MCSLDSKPFKSHSQSGDEKEYASTCMHMLGMFCNLHNFKIIVQRILGIFGLIS